MKRAFISFFIFSLLFTPFLRAVSIPVAYAQTVTAEPATYETQVVERTAIFLDEEDENGKKACDISVFTLNIQSILLCFLGSILGAVTNAGLKITGKFIDFALSLNQTIYADGSLAKLGFDLSLQMTNLLFVVAIIVIAFLIMLRRGGNELIPRLIIVALLINFSFLIATTFIKVSDGVTQVFLDASVGDSSWVKMTDRFTSAFLDIGETHDDDGNLEKAWNFIKTSFSGKSWLLDIAGLLFGVVFAFISIFTLGAVGIMFLIRYIYLTLLTIVLPFALVGLIFPNMGKWWEGWTKQFTRWLFFGPAMGFFIYLAFALLDEKYVVPIDSSTGIFANIGNFIVILAILTGGMIAANNLGIAGAGAAMGGLKKSQAWAQGKAKLAALRLGRSAERKALTVGANPAAKKLSFAQRATTWASETRGVRGIGGLAAAGLVDKRISALKPQAEAEQKRFEGLTDDVFVAKMNASGIGTSKNAPNATFASATMQAAFANEAAKRNVTEKIDPKKYETFVAAAAKMNNTEEILKNRPDLAPLVGKTIEQAVQKIAKDDVGKIAKTALQNVEVTAHFSDAQIKVLGEKGKRENVQVFHNTLSSTVSNDEVLRKISDSHRDLKKLESQIKDSSGEVKNQLAKQKEILTDKIGKDTKNLTETQKKLVKNFNQIRENPNFL